MSIEAYNEAKKALENHKREVAAQEKAREAQLKAAERAADKAYHKRVRALHGKLGRFLGSAHPDHVVNSKTSFTMQDTDVILALPDELHAFLTPDEKEGEILFVEADTNIKYGIHVLTLGVRRSNGEDLRYIWARTEAHFLDKPIFIFDFRSPFTSKPALVTAKNQAGVFLGNSNRTQLVELAERMLDIAIVQGTYDLRAKISEHGGLSST